MYLCLHLNILNILILFLIFKCKMRCMRSIVNWSVMWPTCVPGTRQAIAINLSTDQKRVNRGAYGILTVWLNRGLIGLLHPTPFIPGHFND